jgi:CHASE2 domain-containing sensor protein
MAESAVNQVINARMCKRQQMRWTPRGAHLLVQVRCAVLNGDILEKWKAQEKAAIEPIDPEVQQFLERSQLVAA